MKKRQVLAVVLSAAMVLGSSMTAFATEATTASGDATISGDADISYVDTTKYKVVLPTSSVLQDKLVVDPQGLSKLENGQVATAEELASGAGIITCVGTPIVRNLSSVPMKVSVAMKVTGNATTVDAVNKVESGDATNVLLYAVPSKTDATSGDLYTPSSKGIVLGSSAVTAHFILDPGAYNFSKDASGDVSYDPVSGDVGHGTGLQFGGYVNKKADWSEYVAASSPKKIGLEAKFSFDADFPDSDVADPSGDAYGMMAYGGTIVDVAPADVAPSIATKSYTMVAGQAVTIPVDLGAGSKKATGIASIYNSRSSADIVNTDEKFYSLSGNTLTIKPALTTWFSSKSYPNATLKIKFNDSANTEVSVTLAF